MGLVLFLLSLASFCLWILSAIGKCPAWVPGILMSIALMLMTVNGIS